MVHLLISFTKLEYYSKFGKTTKEHTRSQWSPRRHNTG